MRIHPSRRQALTVLGVAGLAAMTGCASGRGKPSPLTSALAPTGYLGRTTIVEFLVMDDELRRAVMRHAGMGELEQLARKAGMHTMYEDGIGKALAGVTTIEEVLRVTEDA